MYTLRTDIWLFRPILLFLIPCISHDCNYVKVKNVLSLDPVSSSPSCLPLLTWPMRIFLEAIICLVFARIFLPSSEREMTTKTGPGCVGGGSSRRSRRSRSNDDQPVSSVFLRVFFFCHPFPIPKISSSLYLLFSPLSLTVYFPRFAGPSVGHTLLFRR